MQVTAMQDCNRVACLVAVLLAALMLQCAAAGARGSSRTAEPAASESGHAHFLWALPLTAVAVAFAAIGYKFGAALQHLAWLVLQTPGYSLRSLQQIPIYPSSLM